MIKVCLLLAAVLITINGEYRGKYDDILGRLLDWSHSRPYQRQADYDGYYQYHKKRKREDHKEKLYRLLSDIAKNEEFGDRKNLVQKIPETQEQRVIKMPDVTPQKNDTYLCVALKMNDDDRFITKFKPIADMKIAHHMLLFGCEVPFKETGSWKCREMQPVCGSGTQAIKYAWGRNAPSLEMPKNVAFHVGGSSTVKYLVLQVHYLNADLFKGGKTDRSGVQFTQTTERPPYFAGIYLLAAGGPRIPANEKKFHMDMKCLYESRENIKFYPFRFRVHAHKLGAVITAYRLRNGKYTLIGRGDPQRAQAFYPVDNDLDIQSDDILIGRCTYNSTSRKDYTYIGATHSDEMCNFYMMYFYDANNGNHGDSLPCYGVSNQYIQYPIDSDVTLAEIERKSSLLLQNIRIKKKMELLAALKKTYKTVEGWPLGSLSTGDINMEKIGQISGVDVSANHVLIFHRANRKWDGKTFNADNTLTLDYRTPIQEDTLIWLDQNTGQVVNTSGSNLFYLPHGVTIDTSGNLWLTDVGAHQVYKISVDGNKVERLGERFVAGNDEYHFCKPTDVAVTHSGDYFFVADGYCNSRVVKFDSKGKFILEMKVEEMSVVHSLAFDEANYRLFVADRENSRVIAFNTLTGKVISKYKFPNSVYAVAFNNNLLHAVTYDPYNGSNTSGYTYNLQSKEKDFNKKTKKWIPPKQGFGRPHDIAVTKNNKEIYVSGIGPNKLFKLSNEPRSRP